MMEPQTARWPRWIALVAMLAWGVVAAVGDSFGTNLIFNGDAEAGPGSTDGLGIALIPGWTIQGDMSVPMYGIGGGFPETTDPGPEDRGQNFFAGGVFNSTDLVQATQFIELTNLLSAIDGGLVHYNLSGYLGGYAFQDDNAVVLLSFLGAQTNLLGTNSIGPVLAVDRNGLTGLLPRSTQGVVPAGSRRIQIDLLLTHVQGAYNDGYADNLSLIFSPALSIQPLASNQIQLRWPTNIVRTGLQYSPDLAVSQWQQVTNATAVSNGQYVLTVSPNSAARFYRLRF